MKKILLFLALIFLIQKSIAQSCNTLVVTPPPSCASGCTDSVIFFSSGGTPPYDLVVTGGPTVQFNSSFVWTNVCPGSYIYTVTDAALSCQDTGTVTVVSYPLPLMPMPSPAYICLGGSIVMCATGADSYLWSPATGLSSVTDSCPTTSAIQSIVYTVVGTNNSTGCTSSTTISLTVFPPPPIILQVTNESCSGCCDGIIVVSSSTFCSYAWSNLASTQINNNLCSGVYSVIASDMNGCVNTASATVGVGNTGSCSASFAMYPAANPHEYWVVNNSTGALPLQYDWDWGDASPHDTIAFPTHTYPATGIYNITLTITDATGCMNVQILNSYLYRMQQMLTVTVVPQLPTSAGQLSDGDISIYPNPTSGKFRIENSELQIESVDVCNMMGKRLVVKLSVKEDKSSITVDVSELPSGIYFVTVTTEEGNKITRKVIKL